MEKPLAVHLVQKIIAKRGSFIGTVQEMRQFIDKLPKSPTGALKYGDRVQYKKNGKWEFGVFHNMSAGGFYVIMDSGRTHYVDSSRIKSI